MATRHTKRCGLAWWSGFTKRTQNTSSTFSLYLSSLRKVSFIFCVFIDQNWYTAHHFIHALHSNVSSDASESETCARLIHKEHGSAYSSMHSRSTEYLQIIRLVHSNRDIAASSITGDHSAVADSPSNRRQGERKLSYKVFSAARIQRSTSVSSEDDVTEASYEDLTQLQERVNDWLLQSGDSEDRRCLNLNFVRKNMLVDVCEFYTFYNMSWIYITRRYKLHSMSFRLLTGARLVDIETIPVRLRTGGQETLGASATFVHNNREKNVHKELWRVNLRWASSL